MPQSPSCSSRISRFVSLSSTTSTRRPRSTAGSNPCGRRGVPVARANVAVKVKVLPSPTSLVTWIRPPSASTSCHEIARPRPVPPCSRVVDGSAWVKASNRLPWRAGSMPTPVSETSTRSVTRSGVSASRLAWMETSPESVNFTAFEPRLASTCPNRTGSPRRDPGTSGWQATTSSRSLAWAGPLSTSAALSKTARTSKSTCSSSSLPASIFDRSRMSLMIPSRVSPAPWSPSASRRWCSSRSVRSKQVVEADHPVHRGPDLVAHGGEELRLQPGCLHRLVACHRQLYGARLSLGDLAQGRGRPAP